MEPTRRYFSASAIALLKALFLGPSKTRTSGMESMVVLLQQCKLISAGIPMLPIPGADLPLAAATFVGKRKIARVSGTPPGVVAA
jgi:hypothetical protein